ncbi:hypothetical protein OSB04_012843 [Centaurea solstitialis]|uniref:Probable purine permease n=1 Tax=Centaurea solstitialis TaxID=347529 RepID=A0AA38WQ98_9ASTR|nr:hypothetical protein OSB04_012843 [Centaurea solstitialis]
MWTAELDYVTFARVLSYDVENPLILYRVVNVGICIHHLIWLVLLVTQFALQKILKLKTYKVVSEMIVHECLFTSVSILGLFASRQMKEHNDKDEGLQVSKCAVHNKSGINSHLVVQALFSNDWCCRYPIVPVFAVVFFNEKMNKVKVIVMLLAIYDVMSYTYQRYLDDFKENAKTMNINSKSPTQEANEVTFTDNGTMNEQSFMIRWPQKHKKWIQMMVYTIFVLFGQSVATIMGRLYFNKGGNSVWLLTLVQTVGFPALIPFLLISPVRSSNDANAEKPKYLALALLYVFLGVFLAALCVLYSIGLLYLPVSTYSLICASQLGFNAIFAFFLNQQKLTPYIMNSIFILTLSTVLLVFQNSSEESVNTSKGKYAFGFICTICASADESFRAVVAMIIYQSMVSSLVITIGLFASGDWRRLGAEMMKFELGKVAYVMILVTKAVCWQIFSIGTLGLIFKVSCLFSNVVSTVGLPIVPILAVVLFHEEMNGVKMVSMVMAIWGFLSYMYQHYLDNTKG